MIDEQHLRSALHDAELEFERTKLDGRASADVYANDQAAYLLSEAVNRCVLNRVCGEHPRVAAALRAERLGQALPIQKSIITNVGELRRAIAELDDDVPLVHTPAWGAGQSYSGQSLTVTPREWHSTDGERFTGFAVEISTPQAEWQSVIEGESDA